MFLDKKPYQRYYKGAKQEALERNNYTCQICGAEAVLGHHIDGNPKNNNLYNLLAVCRRCNMKLKHDSVEGLRLRNLKKFLLWFYYIRLLGGNET